MWLFLFVASLGASGLVTAGVCVAVYPRIPLRYVTKPTQPPTLSGTGNEYRPKGNEAVAGK